MHATRNVYRDERTQSAGQAGSVEFSLSAWTWQSVMEPLMARMESNSCLVRDQHLTHFMPQLTSGVGVYCQIDWPQPNPQFPLDHRTDLPEHERGISAVALQMLKQGIADSLAGRTSKVPDSVFADEDDNDE